MLQDSECARLTFILSHNVISLVLLRIAIYLHLHVGNRNSEKAATIGGFLGCADYTSPIESKYNFVYHGDFIVLQKFYELGRQDLSKVSGR